MRCTVNSYSIVQFQIGSDAILLNVAIRFENHRVTSYVLYYKEFSKLSGNTIEILSSHVEHSIVIHLIYPKYNIRLTDTCGRGESSFCSSDQV